MKRIFLTLASVNAVLFAVALGLGYAIGDSQSVTEATRKAISYHVLASVAALILAALVQAVILTYFMGTGRWMEETRLAYALDPRWSQENRRVKYRTISAMAACLALLIVNIPLGALSVDRAQWTIPLVGAVSPGGVHLVVAWLTVVVNIAVNVLQFRALSRNARLIAEVVAEVRRIRQAHGLPV